MKTVGIYMLNAPFHIDVTYDYVLPDGINARRGDIVLVPFGRSNRRTYGIVDSVSQTEDAKITENLKTVDDVSGYPYAMGDELFEVAKFMANMTLCTFGECARCVLPKELLKAPTLYSGAKGKVYSIPSPANIKYENYYFLSEKADEKLHTDMQKSIVDFLTSEKSEKEIRENTGASSAQISALVKRGVISQRREEVNRNSYDAYGDGERTEIKLSKCQDGAFAEICRLIDENKPCAGLLFGVTGSGKTQVMLKSIDKVIDSGKNVIMLVPEISLTPQSVRIFCRRYGKRVAVIHSSLSDGERFDAWRRIRKGEVDLVIGTRSAIFAPLDNIGLIIIDEEHEHTYKSDQDPKYHTRDVAAMRCKQNNCPLILASATPSLESFYRAKNGTYTLIPMRERYGKAKLPSVSIVDMRGEFEVGNKSSLSRLLYDKMKDRREKGEQTILLLNRRGYNAQIHCRSCGEVVSCPRCSVALTYHKAGFGGYMCCHICGYREAYQPTCKKCSSDDLSYIGMGTQKAEAEIASYFENRGILRMDADTTATKSAYDNMLGAFRDEEYDILIGTQMVAKGHDFPKVTLVGVISADTSLYVDDFRASERAFSLITQVIGRAGRAGEGGEAVIQTFKPDSEVIRLAASQNYEKFYESEIEKRRELLFPPFCDIVTMTLISDNEALLKEGTERFSKLIKEKGEGIKTPLQVFGPVEAPIYKVMDKYRMKAVIKTKMCSEIRLVLREILKEFSKERDITLTIDINPTST